MTVTTTEIAARGMRFTADIAGGDPIQFEIGEFAKRLLTEGLDPIALTMTDQAQIEAFFKRDEAHRPWIYSAA